MDDQTERAHSSNAYSHHKCTWAVVKKGCTRRYLVDRADHFFTTKMSRDEAVALRDSINKSVIRDNLHLREGQVLHITRSYKNLNRHDKVQVVKIEVCVPSFYYYASN